MALRLFLKPILMMVVLVATESILTFRTEAALAQARDEGGVTLLMRAARDGEYYQAKTLLRQGADVNARDANGWTALIYAAAIGDKEIADALVARGADVNAADETGYTALMAAIAYGNNSIVKLLLDKGVDVNHKDRIGATALDVAAARANQNVTELLKKAGALETKIQPLRSSGSPNALADTKPFALNRPQPHYTAMALNHGVQGFVRLRILVGSDGTVEKVRVLTGLPDGLSDQAIDAAYKIQFKPASKDGQPVAYWLPYEVHFRLAGRR